MDISFDCNPKGRIQPMNQVTKDNGIQDIGSQASFKPGEKGFPVFLFFIGGFFAYQSLLMYQKAPGASSYAAVPLFVSCLIMIFSSLIIFADRKAVSQTHKLSLSQKIMKSFTYMFPKDVLVMILLILLYSTGLLMKFGFYLLTPMFLWLSMSYLMRKHYFKNIAWTGLSLLFIFVVFSFAFKVVLP